MILTEKTYYYDNGNIDLLCYIDEKNRYQGEYKKFFKNGTLKGHFNMKDDLLHGNAYSLNIGFSIKPHKKYSFYKIGEQEGLCVYTPL